MERLLYRGSKGIAYLRAVDSFMRRKLEVAAIPVAGPTCHQSKETQLKEPIMVDLTRDPSATPLQPSQSLGSPLDMLVSVGESTKNPDTFDKILTNLTGDKSVAAAPMRAAALQLRLPDVKVQVGKSGNLSFSARLAGDSTLPKQYASKRLHVSDVTQIDLGDGSDAAFQVLRGQLVSTMEEDLANSEMALSTTDKHTASILEGLISASKLEDPFARSKAVVGMGTQIALAQNNRRIEIRESVAEDLGLRALEQQQAESHARDKADPAYIAGVPGWASKELDDQVRALRIQVSQKTATDIALDPTLNNLSTHLGAASDLANLYATKKAKDSRESLKPSPDDTFKATYGSDAPFVEAMYAAENGGASGSSADMLTFMKNNQAADVAAKGDRYTALSIALDPGTPNNQTVRNGFLALETDLQSREVANNRLRALHSNFTTVSNYVNATKREIETGKFGALEKLPGLALLREGRLALESGIASPKELAAYNATIKRQLLEVAQEAVTTSEIQGAMTSPMTTYPTSEEPAMSEIVRLAEQGQRSVAWINREAIAAGIGEHGAQYAKSYYLNNYKSAILKNPSESAAAFMEALNRQAVGPTPNSASDTMYALENFKGGEAILGTTGASFYAPRQERTQ